MTTVDLVHVFTCGGQGGNPCPVVTDAASMKPGEMQSVARKFGHESGFVLPPPSDDYDYAFRFWVPNHEMEMCGHATIGALWLLATKGAIRVPEVHVDTLSGPIAGFISKSAEGTPEIEITQPVGRVRSLDEGQAEEVMRALRISRADLLDLPIQNAATSRMKTLVPMKDTERLNSLKPDMAAIEAVCTQIGSTGLYPYAVLDRAARVLEARQFPRSSGYPEDPATGIAAAALAFGASLTGVVSLDGDRIKVMQGRAMGRLSEIHVRLAFAGERPVGCLLGGAVTRRKDFEA